MKTKTALIFIFLSILFLGCSNSNTFDRTNHVVTYDMRDDLVPSRLTIAMWDFSWMYGHHPGGPFEDWSKALDELKERKFNTVRIDAFPLLIAELEADGKGVYTYPAKPMITWGQSTVACDHRMKAELVEFMRLTKEQGVYVILSSWGQGDRSKFTDRTKFWKAWETTLDLLKKDNLLDHVVYVDFDQEFPFFSPFQKELNHLAEVKTDASENQAGAMEQAGSNTGAWNKAQAAFVKEYFESTLAHFHEKYPEMRFTFSLTAFWNEVRAIKLKGMDVLELHIWIKGQLDKYTGFSKLRRTVTLPMIIKRIWKGYAKR